MGSFFCLLKQGLGVLLSYFFFKQNPFLVTASGETWTTQA